jgi:hypothetical protein
MENPYLTTLMGNMTKTNTIAILGLVLAVATSAGALSQMMIGTANAQASQASSHACPTGFTLQQGECTRGCTLEPGPPVTCDCPFGGQLVTINGVNECVQKPGNG